MFVSNDIGLLLSITVPTYIGFEKNGKLGKHESKVSY